ncbi:MAG: hypothetical protein Q7S72_00235, partial [Candidatus Taylorbacteria bacterium]|nr:hypothetical protein [Candidatus Taylorbacteria bacterium]
KRLQGFSSELKDIGITKLSFGKVDADELLTYDIIIISSEISKKSLFLKKAISAEIPIEFPETLFFKLSPPITLIGVLGLYGKSSVSQMLYSILHKSFREYKDQGLFFLDPDSEHGALTHLRKIKKDDVVLARIPGHLMSHYHDIHISPHVAVITSLIDFDIIDFQTYNNFIVATDEVVDALKLEKTVSSKAKILRTRPSLIPADWNISPRALHDKENMALVLQTCELFKAPIDIIRNTLQSPSRLRGSVEFIKKVAGTSFYNDANSVTPKATLSALRSLANNKNIILILGGAYTGHDYSELLTNISQYVSTIILLPGSGTLGIRVKLQDLQDVTVVQAFSLEDTVKESIKYAKKTDIVLFSPAFDAVGVDISRKERGEKFVKLVRGL